MRSLLLAFAFDKDLFQRFLLSRFSATKNAEVEVPTWSIALFFKIAAVLNIRKQKSAGWNTSRH